MIGFMLVAPLLQAQDHTTARLQGEASLNVVAKRIIPVRKINYRSLVKIVIPLQAYWPLGFW
jgi:Mlc titration factor MtfA (ptsG expression regulator)